MANVIYPTNYNDLVAELQRYVEDDTEEYTTDLPNILARAQDRVAMDLDLEEFKTVDTSDTLTISSNDLTKPDDCILVRWIFVPDLGRFLELRSLELCKLYTGAGEPKFYAIVDKATFYVAPTPDQSYAIHMGLLTRPDDALASGNQTNWFTDNVPSLLLYACLLESEQYLIDEGGRAEGFRANYGLELAAAKMQYAGHERTDKVDRGAPPPQQPAA